MNARTLAATIFAGFLLTLLAGCTADIGERLNGECQSIVRVARRYLIAMDKSLATQENNDSMMYECILTRGNAQSGGER